MSVCIDLYPYACENCNYECSAKSEKSLKMLKRMHKKKCKKIGRTEKMSVYDEAQQKYDVFMKTHDKHQRFIDGSDDCYTEEEKASARLDLLRKIKVEQVPIEHFD